VVAHGALEVFRADGDGIVAESYDSGGGHTISRVALDGDELTIVADTSGSQVLSRKTRSTASGSAATVTAGSAG